MWMAVALSRPTLAHVPDGVRMTRTPASRITWHANVRHVCKVKAFIFRTAPKCGIVTAKRIQGNVLRVITIEIAA